MTVLDTATNSLSRWMKYFIWQNLYGTEGTLEAKFILGDIGSVLNEVRLQNPGRLPNLDGLPPDVDPLLLLGKALYPTFAPGDEVRPKPAMTWLFQSAGEVAESLGQRRAESQPVDPTADVNMLAPPEVVVPAPVAPLPTPPSTAIGGWRISLYLLKIHCKMETAPTSLTDDFVLLGSYQYGTERGSLRQVSAEFDSGRQKFYASTEEPDGLLLKTCLIPASQDTVAFATSIYAFEDDGLNPSQARLLAGLLGNLATAGINGLLTFATASGVAVPPEAKEAYDNLGLPFIIGFLAKAFGPEPFIPVPAYARTRFPPGAALPQWDAKLPESGGELRSHQGADKHDGNVTLDEAEWQDPIDPAAAAGPVLVAKTDGGKYYVYLRFRVELA